MANSDMLLIALQDKFPPGSLLQFDGMLSDRQIRLASAASYKDPNTALILSIFFGGLGVDRFYNGQVGLGIGKFLTAGGFFVWYLVDIFLIRDAIKKSNLEKFRQTVAVLSREAADDSSDSA